MRPGSILNSLLEFIGYRVARLQAVLGTLEVVQALGLAAGDSRVELDIVLLVELHVVEVVLLLSLKL